MVLRDSPPHLFHNPLQLSGSKCVSMSGHANCIPAPTPPASCTFTCLKGRWMRVTAVCAQQKPQHLNNLNHAAPKGTFVNVQADRSRQQQLLRRFTTTVHAQSQCHGSAGTQRIHTSSYDGIDAENVQTMGPGSRSGVYMYVGKGGVMIPPNLQFDISWLCVC